MMNIVWVASDLHACGLVRGEIPARYVNRSGLGRVSVKRELVPSDLPGTDVVVFQRQLTPRMMRAAELAKRAGCTVVYDLDDNLWEVPDCTQINTAWIKSPETLATLEQWLGMVDCVTVSTDALAQVVEARVPKARTCVLPNYVDLEVWARPRRTGNGMVLGWMASPAHVVDTGLIESALEQWLEDGCKVELAGQWTPEVWPWLKGRDPEKVKVLGWLDEAALAEAVAGWAVGLAPMRDTPFNRCRSGVKVLQYWAAGCAVVASDMPEYRALIDNEVNGLLVSDDPEDWHAALLDMVEYSSTALAGQRAVVEWDMARNVHQWLGTLGRIREASARGPLWKT